jgi:hypothetical protein
LRHFTDAAGSRVALRMAGVQAVHIGEQYQQIGLHHAGHLGA